MIDEENLQQNALEVGTYLLKGFETLRDKYDIIGDVRGKVREFNYLLFNGFIYERDFLTFIVIITFFGQLLTSDEDIFDVFWG